MRSSSLASVSPPGPVRRTSSSSAKVRPTSIICTESSPKPGMVNGMSNAPSRKINGASSGFGT